MTTGAKSKKAPILVEPTRPLISQTIPPNYSTWQTIELTYEACIYVLNKGIPGDFVECGVGPGNNLAAMAVVGYRTAYGFDSFEGIPWAGPNDKEQPGIGDVSLIDQSKIGVLESSGITVHGIDGVHENMKRWGITNYQLIKGWFQDTVPAWDGTISVLRLDGDLYESTMIPLKHLYPKLSKGGILIIDDWDLAGCRKAFDDYFSEHKKPKLIFDNGVTYWQK